MTWLTVVEYLCHKSPQQCSICHNHNPVLSSFMTYNRVYNKVAGHVPHMEQELLALQEHLSSPLAFLYPRSTRVEGIQGSSCPFVRPSVRPSVRHTFCCFFCFFLGWFFYVFFSFVCVVLVAQYLVFCVMLCR